MANKLSEAKISKIIEYKHAGYSQHQTAIKLHINQSTVCHYWNEFDGAAKYAGLEAATQQYGGGDVSELNAFVAEMKKENVSIPELKEALSLWKVFKKLELGNDDYEGIIKACLKINEKSFLDTAVELDQLEIKFKATGMDVITELEETANKLQAAHGEFDQLYVLIKNKKKELAEIQQKTQAADKTFEQHMIDLGLSQQRLNLVENLSLALKKAGIPDEAIGTYLKRQAIFDEAKLDIALFASIVTNVKMVTALDVRFSE